MCAANRAEALALYDAQGADDAAGIVRQLRNISRMREHTWNQPGDTTIDLAMSQR